MPISELSRRTFLHSVAAATALSASGFAQEPGGKINQMDEVQLSQIHGSVSQWFCGNLHHQLRYCSRTHVMATRVRIRLKDSRVYPAAAD
jgi:hypothetical protein